MQAHARIADLEGRLRGQVNVLKSLLAISLTTQTHRTADF